MSCEDSIKKKLVELESMFDSYSEMSSNDKIEAVFKFSPILKKLGELYAAQAEQRIRLNSLKKYLEKHGLRSISEIQDQGMDFLSNFGASYITGAFCEHSFNFEHIFLTFPDYASFGNGYTIIISEQNFEAGSYLTFKVCQGLPKIGMPGIGLNLILSPLWNSRGESL